MKRVFDFSIVDWISKGVDQEGFGKVSNLLPSCFNSYIKILMPICIDKKMPIKEYSYNAKSVEDLNKRVEFWNKYGIINGHPAKDRLERTSYKELSKELNIPYNKHIDTQSIWNIDKQWPPNLGSLLEEDIETLNEIISIIGAATPTFFFGDVLDGKGFQENDDVVDWLFFGELSELTTVYVEQNQDFPSYFFAENKAWCFCHPEDQGFLLLGCGEEVAKKVLKSESIECFEFDCQEQIIRE
ncbi:hypothetical protein [Pontibacter liquoris]|uniref:hypothetical protein n=1 Tax=Pontibacter liquoris TaxID=2905677 RepID=UPI001FA6C0B9|nr:hypothetical protein [Pontibacter liquoris]